MLPCEKMSKYYIPALRVSLARKLYRAGKTQTEVAKLLGITQAAVNKYVSGNYSDGIKKIQRENEIRNISTNVFMKIKSDGLDENQVGKLIMESCGILSKCGVKHD